MSAGLCPALLCFAVKNLVSRGRSLRIANQASGCPRTLPLIFSSRPHGRKKGKSKKEWAEELLVVSCWLLVALGDSHRSPSETSNQQLATSN